MKLLVGNQKSYLTKEMVLDFVNKIKDVNDNGNEVVIAPSDIFISLYEESNCKIACQNVSIAKSGPTTGETSTTQYKSMGVKYAIIGHSERRTNQGETYEDIKKKILNTIEEGIIPILCIGENRNQKANGETLELLQEEILGSVEIDYADKIIYAYEPLWAISDGVNPAIIPTNEEIKNISLNIKNLIKNKFNYDIKVLYGGSVNPKNIDLLNTIDEIDGYLIGGASIKVEDFTYIIKATKD